ncbi:hypothetical protein ACHAXR_009577 [Thalassiosira sp. AJA248-18]
MMVSINLLILATVAAILQSPPPTTAFFIPTSTFTLLGDAANTPLSYNKMPSPLSLHAIKSSDDHEYIVAIIGDLHIDPRKMNDYYIGRSHFEPIFKEAKNKADVNNKGFAVVSLGDLGMNKYCNHNPANTDELYAGTSKCHKMAANFLSKFYDGVPYEVVGGNHDLEGLYEFKIDEENLQMYLNVHDKDTPQFCREIADKTLLVGMGSTSFRNSMHIPHEVIIDQEQIDWFENLLQTHPANEGWKIIVFTHAPITGSGLRILQENQVVDGCCWLNQNDDIMRNKFIELVNEHRCIKAWFSGHFHLGQDYHESITFPNIDPNGPRPNNRGSCVFAQTSVMRSETSRDGRQQSRLIRRNTMEIHESRIIPMPANRSA